MVKCQYNVDGQIVSQRRTIVVTIEKNVTTGFSQPKVHDGYDRRVLTYDVISRRNWLGVSYDHHTLEILVTYPLLRERRDEDETMKMNN